MSDESMNSPNVTPGEIEPDKQKESGPIARRDFLNKFIGGISAAFFGFVIYPIGKYLKQPPAAGGNVKRVVAGKVGDLAPDSGLIYRFGSEPGILINTPAGELISLTAVCTHLGCTVQYIPGESYIFCACHNGKYELSGRVISGPPPRPLEVFQVTVQGDDIIVTRA